MDTSLEIIGYVVSELDDRDDAPKQTNEGAPHAWLRLQPGMRPAMDGLRRGDRIIVVTWLHEADRNTLHVHPRDDTTNAETGVFATRSADRPNPIGLHPTTVLTIEGTDIHVHELEAIDQTPIIDIKIAY